MTLKGRFAERVAKPAYRRLVMPAFWALHSRYPFGTNIYSRDWDVLVVLDTCRVDALRMVADEFAFLPPADAIESMWSVGSATIEWLSATFVEEYQDEIAETIYVTGNPQAHRVLAEGIRPEMDEGLWAPTDWQTVTEDTLTDVVNAWQYDPHPDAPSLGLLPEELTDVAISTHRERRPERMIVHYAEPHHPYYHAAWEEDREMVTAEHDPFVHLRNGGNFDTVWENYIELLRFVLEYVERLCAAIDASTVAITADHGDAFGEWGFYSHPFASFIPCIKKVPWVEISANGQSKYEPAFEITKTHQQRTVEDQLENLGYL